MECRRSSRVCRAAGCIHRIAQRFGYPRGLQDRAFSNWRKRLDNCRGNGTKGGSGTETAGARSDENGDRCCGSERRYRGKAALCARIAGLLGTGITGASPGGSSMKISEKVEAVYDRLEAAPLSPVWISLVPRESALARARERELEDSPQRPLTGMTFAVKDNIDVVLDGEGHSSERALRRVFQFALPRPSQRSLARDQRNPHRTP